MTHVTGGTNINEMGRLIHEISTSKGFKSPSLDNLPEKLMLSVSELAEALEEHRSGKPLVYWKNDKPEGILVEIADSVIRNLHMMHGLLLEAAKENLNDGVEELNISDIINLKVGFNAGRPFQHGRQY